MRKDKANYEYSFSLSNGLVDAYSLRDNHGFNFTSNNPMFWVPESLSVARSAQGVVEVLYIDSDGDDIYDQNESGDTDGDGILDKHELYYTDADNDGVSDQFDSQNTNPANDSDNDGYSNQEEMIAGTDPLEASFDDVPSTVQGFQIGL